MIFSDAGRVFVDFKDGKLIRRKQYLELSEDTQTLLARMLEQDSSQRIPSVDAVLSEINALIDDKATTLSQREDDVFYGRDVKVSGRAKSGSHAISGFAAGYVSGFECVLSQRRNFGGTSQII